MRSRYGRRLDGPAIPAAATIRPVDASPAGATRFDSARLPISRDSVGLAGDGATGDLDDARGCRGAWWARGAWVAMPPACASAPGGFKVACHAVRRSPIHLMERLGALS
jgi:hypothetical protein